MLQRDQFNKDVFDHAKKHKRKAVRLLCAERGFSPRDVDPYPCEECGGVQGHLKFQRAKFDEYKRRFESAQVPADRGRYLSAMGRFKDPEIREQALAYVFVGPLRPNELFRIPGSMMSSAAGRDEVFPWFQENYDNFSAKLPPMFMGFMPFIAGGCSAERLEAARIFFAEPEHQAPGTEKQLAKVSDSVNDCVGLREREGEVVAAWLSDKAATRQDKRRGGPLVASPLCSPLDRTDTHSCAHTC